MRTIAIAGVALIGAMSLADAQTNAPAPGKLPAAAKPGAASRPQPASDAAARPANSRTPMGRVRKWDRVGFVDMMGLSFDRVAARLSFVFNR